MLTKEEIKKVDEIYDAMQETINEEGPEHYDGGEDE